MTTQLDSLRGSGSFFCRILTLCFLIPVSLVSAQQDPPPYSQTELILPFRHAAFVALDGTGHGGNNQRYALDMVPVDLTDSDEVAEYQNFNLTEWLAKNAISSVEQYPCFGEPIIAPAGGEVIEVVSDLADNPPGKTDAENMFGNFVMIAHGNGEFSYLAHFKQGSVTVKQGDVVSQGQELGQCGNSGNSHGAHLHYHMQTDPKLANPAGIALRFSNISILQQPSSTSPSQHDLIQVVNHSDHN
ncbi:hypothetical protein BIY22_02285 [Vibrio panuliri]|uniref:M23ase beta-sheet core domain-containing protein n=1 Tax=Vibrio panuliri TaxID=1381081 RepID=A0A1Q9HR41_9VIBR|nr:M23 family metallopeptidase [Vibrio panuliri]OLQ93340.1 hypothetical protein BIY22_02285 [Vibrio panuliri]